MGDTVANKNRRMRQNNLREALEAGGHIQHVNDISEKLRDLSSTLEPNEVQRLKAAADIKLKLIDKYLPTEKPVEHSGSIGTHDASELTDAELAAIASSSSTRTAKQKDSKKVTH